MTSDDFQAVSTCAPPSRARVRLFLRTIARPAAGPFCAFFIIAQPFPRRYQHELLEDRPPLCTRVEEEAPKMHDLRIPVDKSCFPGLRDSACRSIRAQLSADTHPFFRKRQRILRGSPSAPQPANACRYRKRPSLPHGPAGYFREDFRKSPAPFLRPQKETFPPVNPSIQKNIFSTMHDASGKNIPLFRTMKPCFRHALRLC